MVSKLNNLRKLILGTDLFKQCQEQYVHKDIIKKTISERLKNGLEMRLNELKDKELCLEKCDINMLLNACKLNVRPHKKDYLCISDECKNKLYYDEYKQTHYYDIIKLDCMNKKDKEEILKYAKIEDEQQDKFIGLLSLNEGCIENEPYIYYIAYNKKDNILGGVCQVYLHKDHNTVYIALLTSRYKLDRSSINKGIGTTILNRIKEDYQYNKDYYLLRLSAANDAITFYLKNGFMYMSDDDYILSDINNINPNLIYIFDKLYNIKSRNIKKYLEFAYKNNIIYLIEYYYDNNIYYSYNELINKEINISIISSYKLLPNYIKEGLIIDNNKFNSIINSIISLIDNTGYKTIGIKANFILKKNKIIDSFTLNCLKLFKNINKLNKINIDLLYEYGFTNTYKWIKENYNQSISERYNNILTKFVEDDSTNLIKYYKKIINK